jgi:hypothetical protein
MIPSAMVAIRAIMMMIRKETGMQLGNYAHMRDALPGTADMTQ